MLDIHLELMLIQSILHCTHFLVFLGFKHRASHMLGK